MAGMREGGTHLPVLPLPPAAKNVLTGQKCAPKTTPRRDSLARAKQFTVIYFQVKYFPRQYLLRFSHILILVVLFFQP